MKDQTVDGASGHTWDMFLRKSKILDRWRDTMRELLRQDKTFSEFEIFGDSAYKFGNTYLHTFLVSIISSALTC